MEMDKLKSKKIAIIGMGHMGKALYEGLLKGGFKKDHLFLSNRAVDNHKVVKNADWVILTVKPFAIKQVVEDIAPLIKGKVLLSAAAGISIDKIVTYAGNNKQPIVRIMPNLPIACNQGVIGLFANKYVSEKSKVVSIFSLLGKIIHCKKEADLEILTIISGCGPAIVAYCINMLAYSGQTFGLKKTVSNKIALETFLGTLVLMGKTNQSAIELQSAVATKGGVTEEIIKELGKRDLYQLFGESLTVGYDKIKKIKEDL